MNKKDLINSISKKTGFSKQKVSNALRVLLLSIVGSLNNGEKLTINGFGTFSLINRKERMGRNPKTGESILIPNKNVVKFKPSSKIEIN